MRIRSDGPSRATSARGAEKAIKAGGAKFAGLVGGVENDTEDRARKLRSALLEELAELAHDVDGGKATKEEASRRFVGMVIRQRFGDKQGKGQKTMEETIGELVENDPTFVGTLHANLKKLAKG
jgi:hypothetical protein